MPGPFTYQSNIPAATDTLATSQGDIQTNFASIESLIDVDHVDFNDANAGMHNQITLPLNDNSPIAPVFSSPNIGLYNLVPAAAPLTNINELFINKYVNGLVQKQIPMTASTLSTNAVPAAFSTGYTYLPSGIIMKWGQFPFNQNPATTIVFDATVPFTQILSLQLTPNVAGGAVVASVSVKTTLVNATGFTAITNATAGFISYLAIGY